jgi:hypothetical protein
MRGRTNMRRSYLADTVSKLDVTSFEEILTLKKITITIGKQVERPPY